MNHTAIFDGKGTIYAKARPSYAEALFGHLRDTLHLPEGSVFADVGSGTGIFSEQLVQHGYRVYAVEPNGDMRKQAEEKLSGCPGFTSVNGTDRDTTLPGHSVDCVTAAQAFHWFDGEAFRKECRRILIPGGRVLLVYNFRDETAESGRALVELQRNACPRFGEFRTGMSDEDCRRFFGGQCQVFRADNSQIYDRQGYVNRALSSSYSLREGDAGFAQYLAELHRLFDRFSENGRITVPTFTIAYIGTV